MVETRDLSVRSDFGIDLLTALLLRRELDRGVPATSLSSFESDSDSESVSRRRTRFRFRDGREEDEVDDTAGFVFFCWRVWRRVEMCDVVSSAGVG